MSNNPQAFPHLVPHNQEFAYTEIGMTLRDYFAGQALLGFCANTDVTNAVTPEIAANTLATMSYEVADAMLAERAKAVQS